jgi:hypothetical protein
LFFVFGRVLLSEWANTATALIPVKTDSAGLLKGAAMRNRIMARL